MLIRNRGRWNWIGELVTVLLVYLVFECVLIWESSWRFEVFWQHWARVS